MAEIIVAIFGLFVTPVIEIGKIIAAPIKDRLNYLRSFDSNKESLTEEAEKLKIQMDSLQRRVDAANTNIRSDVIAWLDDCRSNQEKTSGIEDELRRAPSGCLAIKSRYSLSKKAKKTADAMKDLGERKFEEISVPASPASMDRLNYLRSFDSNKESLRDEAEKLKHEIAGLQMRVDAANRNADVILPDVQAWLDESNKNQVKAMELYDEMTNAPGGCSDLNLRYSESKKAKNLVDAMKDLRERGTFPEISVPAPPASMAPPTPQGPSDHEFPSRKQIEEKIMEDLRGGNIHMMGICGMGGVGKTTMAKRIKNKVKEENLFDEVVMAVVSQPVDQRKIQDEIADSLDLELKRESIQVRAYNLRTRVMGGKRILLILDDVWEWLNLEELGIPCKSDVGGGCTIVLTSRNKDVLNQMDAKPYAMEILSEEEAWSLFREKVGTWLDDSDLTSIAKEVANECKGLPLALTIVGMTLKNEKEKYVWEDAVRQLKNLDLDLLEGVYKPLKLSYVYLKNQQAGSLFLLCCIFPEDHNIHLEYLTSFGIGLRMFEGMSVEEARNRVRTLLKILKGRFLLLDGCDENHVKMHDVVRDVALLIALEEGLVGHNLSNCKWISVVNKLPIDLSFPSLRLFLMGSFATYSLPVNISINSSFFQGMEKLNVLYFSGISCRSLPETTQLLKNLRTLYLNCCYSLKTISIVGELLSLEILICRNCDQIAELPVEIRRLERLKLLEVSRCKNLKRIAPGVISKLVQLEELIIVGSFVGWERKTNGKQRVNAAFCELEHLKNLTRLDIEIEDVSLVTEEMCFSTKIVNPHIRFMSKSTSNILPKYSRFMSGMDLILGKDITVARWIHVFLRSTHFLRTTGDGSNSLDLAQVQNLKRLICCDCSTMNKLVNITSSMNQSFDVFRFLEYLKLANLPNLEEICQLPKSSNSFRNLKGLEVYYCPKLRKLFPLAIAKDGLLLLEKLKIKNCEMMEEVFANEENEKDGDQCHMITFPKLKSLVLSDLPNLTTFCKGSESIKFLLLNEISINGCGNLKSLNSGSCNNLNLEGHDADSFHLFCNQKVSFGSLMKIEIRGLDKCNKLFSSAIIKDGLLQLEELEIGNCEMMEEVFSNEENGMDGVQCHTITFPKLNSLYLECLPRLTSFCKGSENIEFPLLEEFVIYNCEKLTSLISSTCDSLNLKCHDHDSINLFCNQKVSFGCLKEIFFESYGLSNMWCHQIPVGFFSQLVILVIRSCNVIRSLFSSSIAANFVNLKELEIYNGNEMVKVIEDIDEEMLAADQNPHCILFPSLKNLVLYNLLKLQSFCNWRCDLMLPSLEHVNIDSCPLLEMESVIFGNLKEIDIVNCDISSLFSSSIAKKLVNLTYLTIFNCNEMVKVIEDIDEEMLAADQNPYCILFPSLKDLHFYNLPKLQSFYNWRCDLQLPSLKRVWIDDCPLLEFFTMGSVSTPNLKRLKTDDYRDKDVGDLNSAIQQLHFETNQHQPISTPKETSTSDNKQTGAEEDHQKSEIQEPEQINEEFTSAQMKE